METKAQIIWDDQTEDGWYLRIGSNESNMWMPRNRDTLDETLVSAAKTEADWLGYCGDEISDMEFEVVRIIS